MNDLKRVYSKLLSSMEEERQSVNKDYWRMGYHLMPPMGWLNDPNGLCEYNGEYHIYYQYSPFEAEGGLKFWGHYSTKDFINYKENDIAIFPDQPYDCHGVFSGTAFIEDEINFFYTGMVQRQGYKDYEFTGMEQNTVLVTSKDGVNFSNKELLLRNEDYPENMSWHVRDPKVWKQDNKYYMILGAKTLDNVGCALIYTSKDKYNWKYLNTVQSDDRFGYMWECPDYIKVDNQSILICCPQGVENDGIDYINVHQCGYFLVDGDITSQKNYSLSKFYVLDRGFDFYAPQTFKDCKGRTILIGWVSISDTPFENPTVQNGWQHCLSLPRELKIINGKLTQNVISELKKLRDEGKCFDIRDEETKDLQGDKYELQLDFYKSPRDLSIILRKDTRLSYNNETKEFKLNLGKSGFKRDERKVKIDELRNLVVYSDTSIIEIFLNDGEEVFTTRIYCEAKDIVIDISGKELLGKGILYKLNDFGISQ